MVLVQFVFYLLSILYWCNSNFETSSSRECQIKDWPNHKIDCHARQKECSVNFRGKDIWDDSDFKTDQKSTFCETVQSEQSEITHGKDIWDQSDFGERHRNHKAVQQRTAKLIHTSPGIVGSRNVTLPEAVQEPKPQPSAVEEIKPEISDRPVPPEVTKSSYLYNNMVMTDVPVLDPSQPVITITVKANKQKLAIGVHASWTSQQMCKLIAHRTQIPLDKLKLIHRGKVVDKNQLHLVIKNKAVFQALGEQAECEDGLDARDIELLMKQLSVERNQAIKALRKEGDVLDAILHVANK